MGHVILMPMAHLVTRHSPTRGRPRLGGLHHAYELAEQVARLEQHVCGEAHHFYTQGRERYAIHADSHREN
jgi:hypothetical protein